MKSISKETIESINSSINNLSLSELKGKLAQTKAKQRDLYEFLWLLTEEIPGIDKNIPLHYLFLFTLKCYKHFYGRLSAIDQKTIIRTMNKWSGLIEYTDKISNPTQLVNELNRNNRQPELTKFLENYLNGNEDYPNTFQHNEISMVKIKFLFIFNILNVQVKINYPEPV